MRSNRSWRRLVVVLLAVGVVSFGPPAHPAVAQTGGSSRQSGSTRSRTTLDPHASPSAGGRYQIIASVTENLLYRGPDGKLVALARPSRGRSRATGAASPSSSRRDVKFHDWHPVQRRRGQVQLRPHRWIRSSRRAAPAPRWPATRVPGCSTSLRCRSAFETPYSPFLNAAAAGILSLVSPKAVRESGDLVHTRPVGSGPFMIRDYVAKDHTTMVRNPAYTRKAPWSERSGPAPLDSVVWKFIPEAGTRVTTLESGETHGIYLVPSQALPRIEKDSAMRVEKLPWPGVPRIWLLNTMRPPFDDVRVRRAVNYAVDKEAFLATVYRGTGLKAFAPLTAVMVDDPALRQAYPFDPGQGQGAARRVGLAAGRRRHPSQGRAAARDRPERHRVTGAGPIPPPSSSSPRCATWAST